MELVLSPSSLGIMRVKGTGMCQALSTGSRVLLFLQGLVWAGNPGLAPVPPALGLGRLAVLSVQMEKLSPEWGKDFAKAPYLSCFLIFHC